MKTIALYNLKGGVGKTVTAANLAHLYVTGRTHRPKGGCYGRLRRALLLDCDPQGNLSLYFRRYEPERECGLRCGDAEETDWYGLDIMTGNLSLYRYERHLFKHHDTHAIAKLLEKRHDYDLAIIDCPPALSMMTINALAAADYIIIPTRLDAFSAQGLEELDTQLHDVRKINPRLKLLGVLITHDENNDMSRKVEGVLRMNFPVFRTKISRSHWIADSTVAKTPLAEMEKGMHLKPAWQYRKLANEIMEEIK